MRSPDNGQIKSMTGGDSSLASSLWMRVISRYLTWSVRAGAYAANFYFLSIIDIYMYGRVRSTLLRHLLYLVYGVLLYEVAARIVTGRYRPKFVCEDEVTDKSTNPLVLNRTDYAYRMMAEKLICLSVLYYGFSLIIAVMLVVFLRGGDAWQFVGLGMLGGFLSVFNFIGIVFLSASGNSFSWKSMPLYILAFFCIVPLLVYILFTIRWAFPV